MRREIEVAENSKLTVQNDIGYYISSVGIQNAKSI